MNYTRDVWHKLVVLVTPCMRHGETTLSTATATEWHTRKATYRKGFNHTDDNIITETATAVKIAIVQGTQTTAVWESEEVHKLILKDSVNVVGSNVVGSMNFIKIFVTTVATCGEQATYR